MSLGKSNSISAIYMQLQRWNNFYNNKVVFGRLNSNEKKLITDNAKYKNKYKGKKCFIIGNGPSVNNMDFDWLNKELVITVNEMFRHKKFNQLNSNFHFIADPVYLQLNKRNAGDAEIINKIHFLADSNTTLFFPIQGAKLVRQYGWHKKLNIQYFSSRLYYYDNYKEDFDFARYLPIFQAVVQWAIAFAIDLGCSEIDLLGCDATNIVTDVSLFAKQDVDLTYAYDLSQEAADLVKKKHKSLGLECTLYGYWRIVHLFSELYEYCKKNGVNLYNCSENTILDCIPRRRLDDIL